MPTKSSQASLATGVWYLVITTSTRGMKASHCQGLNQTNQRAQLLVCILALQSNPEHSSCTKKARCIGRDCHFTICYQDDNAELWCVLHTELARLGKMDQFVKVKGHAKDCDGSAGGVPPIDKWEHDGADALVVAGAESHAVPDAIVVLCNQRAKIAQAKRSMMLQMFKSTGRRRASLEK